MNGVFLDTSVFVSGLLDLDDRIGPKALVDEIAEGRLDDVHTAWHCCLEFYSVVTRLPLELRLTPSDAHRLVREEILGRAQVHQMPTTAHGEFFELLAADGIAGGRVYDAHIGAVAHCADVEIVVTENRRHFTSLLRHGIRVLTAEEMLVENPPQS